LILLACDTYDVPSRGKDDELMNDASEAVFTYILCSICPVRSGKLELGYFSVRTNFMVMPQAKSLRRLSSALCSAFDNRSANIYNALLYSRSTSQTHHEFIDAVFRTEAPMSAEEQQAAFNNVLTALWKTAAALIQYKLYMNKSASALSGIRKAKTPSPLISQAREVGEILQNSGISEEQVQMFQINSEIEFGDGAVLNPANIINSGKFELVTPQVKVSVNPECSYMLDTKVINGRKYILIPADEGVELNGLCVSITG
jgi:hypothetical protein